MRTSFPYADWHTHATFYRTGNPNESARIEAMLQRGADLKLERMGVGEHMNDHPSHPVACYEQLAHDLRHGDWPIPAFLAAEVDILGPDGRLSYAMGLSEQARPDYVIASVHHMDDYADSQGYLETYQRLMMGAITADRGAQILGHPWHNANQLVERGWVSAWRFEMIPEAMLTELIDALHSHRVAIEINRRAIVSFQDPAFRAFVLRLRDAGVKVAPGSDAHNPERLDAAPLINQFLADLGFGADDVWMPSQGMFG